MKFTIIGINDNKDYPLPQEVRDIIYRGQVFSGGKRHHELMAHLLPEHYQWIDITVPLSEVFHQYQPHEHVIVFASGDPLFFGFANTSSYTVSGIISLIVGIILLFVPNASLVTLSVIVTIFLIVEGILFIVDGVRMKELKFDQTIDM